MTPDNTTLFSYHRGTLPDRYWYQLNGKSAAENYIEQKRNQPKQDVAELIIKSEVKVK